MQVSKINNNFTINEQRNENKGVHFKGKLDSFCLGVSDIVEYGGLAASFTIQDMLGTNFPRTIAGATRNSDENNGELNLSFAAKEAVREFVTGPSMFLIPMGIIGASKSLLGKACAIPADFISAFGKIHSQNSIKDSKITNQEEFFKNTFTEIIKNAKNESKTSDGTLEISKKFAKDLSEALNSGDKKVINDTIESMFDSYVKISKRFSNPAHTDFTSAKVTDNVSSSFKKTVSHMINYSEDMVKKAQKQDKKDVKHYINNTVNKKIIGRFALNTLMYSSVIGFLQVIPKLYNKAEGDQNAGLKGLMRDETFNDKKLNEAVRKKNKNEVKANPSFGSLSDVAKKFNDGGIWSKFVKMMEFDGCSMSFSQLVALMGGGIIYPRLKNAKDDYDREEILRRDLVTCVAMCVAEKELRKGFSKLNENSSGLVLAAKQKGFNEKPFYKKLLDYLNPVGGVNILSSDQIRAKYTNIDRYKGGVKGFCEFISANGGNLGKLFSLDETSKKLVNEMLKETGEDITTADNETITKVIADTKNRDKVTNLAKLFHESKRKKIEKKSLMDKILQRNEILEDNKWVSKARTLNARFSALSIVVLVPVFLGLMLPKINEYSTKKRIKKELALKKSAPKVNKNTEISINTEKNKIVSQKSIFADITNQKK